MSCGSRRVVSDEYTYETCDETTVKYVPPAYCHPCYTARRCPSINRLQPQRLAWPRLYRSKSVCRDSCVDIKIETDRCCTRLADPCTTTTTHTTETIENKNLLCGPYSRSLTNINTRYERSTSRSCERRCSRPCVRTCSRPCSRPCSRSCSRPCSVTRTTCESRPITVTYEYTKPVCTTTYEVRRPVCNTVTTYEYKPVCSSTVEVSRPVSSTVSYVYDSSNCNKQVTYVKQAEEDCCTTTTTTTNMIRANPSAVPVTPTYLPLTMFNGSCFGLLSN